ncbi:MAG: hypothetical protein AAFP04_04850 [Myxococcota bacterium]
MSTRRGAAIVAALLFVWCALPAELLAQSQGSKIDPGEAVRLRKDEADAKPYPQHRLVYSNLVALRFNPIGLENQLDLSYRYRLYDSAAPILRESYLGVAFTPSVSPAIVRLGATLEFRPLSILYFSAGYYGASYFGLFNFTQDYRSPRADHSDTALSDDDAISSLGQEAQLRGQLLLKFGPIVVRNDLNGYWGRFDLEDPGATVYYNPRLDLLMPNNGWGLVNDSDVLYLGDGGLVLGLRSTLSHAFYRDRDFLPGESTENPNTPHWRVGPLVAYQLYDDPNATWFNRPTILVIAQWWVDHRFRTGEDVSQAVPYFVAGLRFDHQLWSSP